MYKKGDVILVPFPFSDLSSTKIRPVVVVSERNYEKETHNLIVAMITSITHVTPYDYELKDWQIAGLLSPSWVRAKLATLNPSLVRYKTGRLSDSDLGEVEKIIKSALEL